MSSKKSSRIKRIKSSKIETDLHTQLKTALKLLDMELKEFAAGLAKPDGTRGISHTAVIRVAKEYDNTQWIKEEIHALINKAHRLFPDYYEYHLEKVKNS